MKTVRAILFLVALLALATTAPAASPDPLEGNWDVTGWEPGTPTTGEPTYSGQVSLHKRGEAYAFEGSIDGGEYFGIGLFDPKAQTLSLAFQGPSGEDTGLTVFVLKNGVMEGRWIYLTDDEGRTGRETWKRSK